jgi:hypothetical protein
MTMMRHITPTTDTIIIVTGKTFVLFDVDGLFSALIKNTG